MDFLPLCMYHKLFPWPTWGVPVIERFGRDTQIPLIHSKQAIAHIHTRELEPAHTPPTFMAYSLPPALTSSVFSTPSLSLSICHSPAFPSSSSSFSDLMSSLAQAPLGSTVSCGVSSHSRWKKKRKQTHMYAYRPVHTHHWNQRTQCTSTAGRSQPCSLRPHPDRLLGSRPLRAAQPHFLLIFFLPVLCVCVSSSLPLSTYLFSDTPCGR